MLVALLVKGCVVDSLGIFLRKAHFLARIVITAVRDGFVSPYFSLFDVRLTCLSFSVRVMRVPSLRMDLSWQGVHWNAPSLLLSPYGPMDLSSSPLSDILLFLFGSIHTPNGTVLGIYRIKSVIVQSIFQYFF